jgi:predicted DCC family thiol-disulfide oxidoreductase YuxK
MSESGGPNGPIVFFDGVCNLCNGAVDWLVKHDREHRIQYASLQGSTAAQMVPDHLTDGDPDSILVWTDGVVLVRSDAVLKLLGYLSPGYRFLGLLGRIVPRLGRDAIYKWVARHRYRWFGKRESCRLPTPEERATFLP